LNDGSALVEEYSGGSSSMNLTPSSRHTVGCIVGLYARGRSDPLLCLPIRPRRGLHQSSSLCLCTEEASSLQQRRDIALPAWSLFAWAYLRYRSYDLVPSKPIGNPVAARGVGKAVMHTHGKTRGSSLPCKIERPQAGSLLSRRGAVLSN
jgi:hypothetical protein